MGEEGAEKQIGDEQEYLLNLLIVNKPTYKGLIVPGGQVRGGPASRGSVFSRALFGRGGRLLLAVSSCVPHARRCKVLTLPLCCAAARDCSANIITTLRST